MTEYTINIPVVLTSSAKNGVLAVHYTVGDAAPEFLCNLRAPENIGAEAVIGAAVSNLLQEALREAMARAETRLNNPVVADAINALR